MAHSLPTEALAPGLDRDGQRQLLAIARAAIARGEARPCGRELAALPAALRRERAVFVTLIQNGSLRGCIGSLVATAPLAQAVADAAHGAAHRDPRFPPLHSTELAAVQIEISVLSALEPMAVNRRSDLISTLRPGRDGLLLEDGARRSTFLPKVWEQLPDPEDFLDQLLAKAGLSPQHWSPTLRLHRYSASSFGDADPDSA